MLAEKIIKPNTHNSTLMSSFEAKSKFLTFNSNFYFILSPNVGQTVAGAFFATLLPDPLLAKWFGVAKHLGMAKRP